MNIDLICVVADKNIEASLDALLGGRRQSLGLRTFCYELQVHPRRDPGCYREGPVLLRGLIGGTDAKGLVVFDHAWDGNPHTSALETEANVRARLPADIEDRADIVVIEPEIEAWVWSSSPHVGPVLGWDDSSVRLWLRDRDLWPAHCEKPPDPKTAMEHALREKRIPRSSSLYRQLAYRVGLASCRDASFLRLRSVLRRWFVATEVAP